MDVFSKKNGFTLVELLGVIVIIGILSAMAITGVTRLIDKTKNVSDDTLKDTARMAAESYMQANKDEMPKSIGETTDLKIKTLINSNYIKEFKNSKKQDCTDNSYVKVYKQSKNKYVYTPYIYCGDSQTITNSGSDPKIDIKVQDNTTKFVIVITKNKDHNLNGYSFTLSTITKDSSNNNVTTEVYNSGSIQINNKKNFSKEYDISNYIDVTTANAIKIDALAYNDVGERTTDSITVSYTDKTPPTCTIESIYPPIGDNQWIGKDDYKNGIKRKVVAKCSDAESGCKRATFTSTWPKKNAKSVTTAKISVYDNAGNEGICDTTNINVDTVSPSATLKAKSGNTIVTKKDHVVNDKTPSDTIKVDDYKNLSSNWMNKTNYPNGVTYEVTATDDFLDSWTWEVNASGQSNVDEKAISSTNADGKTGNFTNSKTINVGFTGEGKRYGVLTIKDKAGNKVTYKIYANIDKTDPTCLSSYSEPSNYNGSWTNKNITLVGKCSDSGSGCESNAKKTITTDTNGNISPGTVSDKAGNTVSCGSKLVKIDKVKPVIEKITITGTKASLISKNTSGTIKYTDVYVYNNEGSMPYYYATANDSNSGIANYSWNCTSDDENVAKVLPDNSDNRKMNISIKATQDIINNIKFYKENHAKISCTVTVKDKAGNITSSTLQDNFGNGWIAYNLNSPNDKWYFVAGNKLIKGWAYIYWGLWDHYNWYYFDETGLMLVGWQKLTYNGGPAYWYFFYPTYNVGYFTSWEHTAENNYAGGAMIYGGYAVRAKDGVKYYFDNSGHCTNDNYECKWW